MCAVIWISHHQSKLFYFSPDAMERKSIDPGADLPAWYDSVIQSVSKASQLLILGPDIVRHQLRTHLRENYPFLLRKIVACDSLELATDAAIASHASTYFKLRPSGAA